MNSVHHRASESLVASSSHLGSHPRMAAGNSSQKDSPIKPAFRKTSPIDVPLKPLAATAALRRHHADLTRQDRSSWMFLNPFARRSVACALCLVFGCEIQFCCLQRPLRDNQGATNM